MSQFNINGNNLYLSQNIQPQVQPIVNQTQNIQSQIGLNQPQNIQQPIANRPQNQQQSPQQKQTPKCKSPKQQKQTDSSIDKNKNKTSISTYHAKLVKYGFCTSGDQYLGLKIFSFIGRVIIQDKYQNSYVISPIKDGKLNDLDHRKFIDAKTSHLKIDEYWQQNQDYVHEHPDKYFPNGCSDNYSKIQYQYKSDGNIDETNYKRFINHVDKLYQYYVNDDDKLERQFQTKENLGEDISNDVQVLRLLHQKDPKEVYDIYETIEKLLDSDSDLMGLYDEFTDKRNSKTKKQGNTQFTPQCVSELMAKLALKYIKMIRGDEIYISPADYSPYKNHLCVIECWEQKERKPEEPEKSLYHHKQFIDYNTGISVIDPGSGYNALTNAILDECAKHRIKLNHLRAYDVDFNVINVAEILLMKKLYRLHDDYAFDVCVGADNISDMPQAAMAPDSNDIMLFKGAISAGAKVEQNDYLSMNYEDLKAPYMKEGELIDIVISNPPYTAEGNLKDPVSYFIRKSMEIAKVGVFILPKNSLYLTSKLGKVGKDGERKNETRDDRINDILQIADVVEMIDMGDQKKIFNGHGISDTIILVMVRKEFINKVKKQFVINEDADYLDKEFKIEDIENVNINEISKIKNTYELDISSKNYKYFDFRDYGKKYKEKEIRGDLIKWKDKGLEIQDMIIRGKVKEDMKNDKEKGFVLMKYEGNNIIPKEVKNAYVEMRKQLINDIMSSKRAAIMIGAYDKEMEKMINEEVEDVGKMNDIDVLIKCYEIMNKGEKLDRQHLSAEPELLSNYFEIVSSKGHLTSEAKPKDEINIHPLIGAAKTNNGIIGYISTFDCNPGFTLAKTGDGAAGYLFYHNYNFSLDKTHLFYLQSLQEIKNITINCKLISLQLHTIFNSNNSMTKENFKNIKVYLYH